MKLDLYPIVELKYKSQISDPVNGKDFLNKVIDPKSIRKQNALQVLLCYSGPKVDY